MSSTLKPGEYIDREGVALGWHVSGATYVRRTTRGRFAILDVYTDRIIGIFDDHWAARRYNFAIHGDKLGE